MLHKTDKEPIYGVRGVMRFFRVTHDFHLKEIRTHEKTCVFSHALSVSAIHRLILRDRFQIFLRIAVQYQIGVLQRCIVDQIVKL